MMHNNEEEEWNPYKRWGDPVFVPVDEKAKKAFEKIKKMREEDAKKKKEQEEKQNSED